MDDCRYFLITHKFNKKVYRAKGTSKTRLKRSLPRFCGDSQEYKSLWDIEEISGVQYFNKRELPYAPDRK